MDDSSASSNQKTIQSYEAHIQEYINGTPSIASGIVKEWIDDVINRLTKNARILEFGSAFGRDATYLQQMGYKVECSDATQAFVDLLLLRGFNARRLNAITDDLIEHYDLIFANAVLLHFTRQELKLVLGKVHQALNINGRFAFTLKQGSGEEWIENKLGAPRYYHYWEADQIRKLLKDAGYKNIKVLSDRHVSSTLWLQIIVIK